MKSFPKRKVAPTTDPLNPYLFYLILVCLFVERTMSQNPENSVDMTLGEEGPFAGLRLEGEGTQAAMMTSLDEEVPLAQREKKEKRSDNVQSDLR